MRGLRPKHNLSDLTGVTHQASIIKVKILKIIEIKNGQKKTNSCRRTRQKNHGLGNLHRLNGKRCIDNFAKITYIGNWEINIGIQLPCW